MKLFVCIHDDARLLPHFLRHYDRRGVREFHIAAPAHLGADVREAGSAYAIRHYDDLDVAESVLGGVAAVTAMRRRAQAAHEWIVIVDLDEFVELPVQLTDMVARIEAEGANLARGIMYDRFAADGQPTAFDDRSDLRALFPVRARFTKHVMGGVDHKGVILKGHLQSAGAHHEFHGQRVYSQLLEISHYKWHDRCLARLRAAYDTVSAAQIHWAWQYKAALDHYDAHGRFAWDTCGGELLADASA